MKTNDLTDLANATGFPLQQHLFQKVRDTNSEHGWHVIAPEHRWESQDAHNEGFIDFVLQKGNVRLVIECKRIDGRWLFLIPKKAAHEIGTMRILAVDTEDTDLLKKYPTCYKWKKLDFEPFSYEAMFCGLDTVNNKDATHPIYVKDNRTLEKISGELLLSLEHLAIEEKRIFKPAQFTPQHLIYIPIVVTSALLYVCLFNPENVDPRTGAISPNDAEIKQVSFIRFAKALSTSINYQKPPISTLNESNAENMRSVLVADSTELINVLRILGQF